MNAVILVDKTIKKNSPVFDKMSGQTFKYGGSN